MPYDFEVSGLVAASPEAIYRAWMSSDGHSAMTGGEAHVDPVVGGEFTAWDQYIKGTTLELDPLVASSSRGVRHSSRTTTQTRKSKSS
ncbi:MAG: hypothetical protein ABR963_08730 [Acidimicrobiales bacterium]|jgi:hypothetical protein